MDIELWHGLINNTINTHFRNNYRSLPFVPELNSHLNYLTSDFSAVEYGQSLDTVENREEMRSTGLHLIDVKRSPLSHRKKKFPKVLRELRSVRPATIVEAHLVSTCWLWNSGDWTNPLCIMATKNLTFIQLNIRGVAEHSKLTFNNYLETHKPTICCLNETKRQLDKYYAANYFTQSTCPGVRSDGVVIIIIKDLNWKTMRAFGFWR